MKLRADAQGPTTLMTLSKAWQTANCHPRQTYQTKVLIMDLSNQGADHGLQRQHKVITIFGIHLDLDTAYTPEAT